jgi:hypothetical protein
MANLQDIRRRIASVKNTQQITKAMKMVAAAKMKKAQNAILAARPYAQKMHLVDIGPGSLRRLQLEHLPEGTPFLQRTSGETESYHPEYHREEGAELFQEPRDQYGQNLYRSFRDCGLSKGHGDRKGHGRTFSE